jgi:hypothetical protein
MDAGVDGMNTRKLFSPDESSVPSSSHHPEPVERNQSFPLLRGEKSMQELYLVDLGIEHPGLIVVHSSYESVQGVFRFAIQ